MPHVQVLGTGCERCEKLANNVQIAITDLGMEVDVEKVSDINEILAFGVPTTPALVVDGVVKVVGRLPDIDEIKDWIEHKPGTSSHGDDRGSQSVPSKCCCAGDVQPSAEVSCCGEAPPEKDWTDEVDEAPWIIGTVETSAGTVPKVSTFLNWSDHVGGWRARWGIGRTRYRIKPRLYAVGQPTCDSPVLVSANYKMSFDRLRSELTRLDAWILVLDTKGINVWCAAGKGTFGTDELIRQIDATRLPEIVSCRRVIVPQLGAPGVAAHKVREHSDFRVVYGSVRAKDIPAFLKAGLKATPVMRRVEFPLVDRLAVVPVEIVQSLKWALLIATALLLSSGLAYTGYSWARAFSSGLASAALYLLAYLFGAVLTAALLPWLPGRALALKGLWTGIGLCVVTGALYWQAGSRWQNPLEMTTLALLALATNSFMAMKFTGSTTYTSLSGVRREMRVAVPLQLVVAVVGVVFWTWSCFV